MVRIDVAAQHLKDLEEACEIYYNMYVLFRQVNLTVWTIGKVVPYHAWLIYRKYGYGMGIVSMQGRESKHIQFVDYVCHASGSEMNKMEIAFRHEFCELIYLRQEKPSLDSYKSCDKIHYIPTEYTTRAGVCYCGLKHVNGSCQLCEQDTLMCIEKSCIAQKCLL